MKKIIFDILMLAIGSSVFSQPTGTSQPPVKVDYLQKSKKQSTIALAFGIPGVALFTIGGIMFMSEFEDGLTPGSDYDEKKVKTGEALMIAGAGLAVVAIPFQLASRKNKKLAMTIGLKTESQQQLQKRSLFVKSFPSLALKLSL